MDWKEFLKMTNAYTRAYTEVLEILSHFSKEEYAKIPTKKIEFYRSNMALMKKDWQNMLNKSKKSTN